jgi:hypothetical protein
MREPRERSTSGVAADTSDPLMTAYANLCDVIATSSECGTRVHDSTIARLSAATASMRARSDCPGTMYHGLIESLTKATVLVERLEALERTGVQDELPTRALFRGELRRTLATVRFVHVTPSELAQAAIVVATSRARRAAFAVAQSPARVRVARRGVSAAAGVFDRMAAAARQRPLFATHFARAGA